MFTVNSDMCIKMNRGDEVQLPLFVNNGTRIKPLRYTFEPDDGCEVYFYLLPLHKSYKDFILKKTFKSSGEIITEKCGDETATIKEAININDAGDMVITLETSDTENLFPGNYVYVVRAKILAEKIQSPNLVKENLKGPESAIVGIGEADYMTLGQYDSKYVTLQITNKYNFYLLDDDINRAW